MSDIENFEADPADIAEQESEVADEERNPFPRPATRDPEAPEADAAEQAFEVPDDEEEDPR
ncbi:MAG: hypothetical protein J2P58_11260 [Acidimicrobiaceae bacterium]|nr:hypothetical protein [Acidimicrobiaceae bacterium]